MKSIFIVDDIKINLKVLEVLLTRNGYKTISALNGIDALSKLQGRSVDLILSDIQMPQMDGFQFCRLCKLDDSLKHIPFLFYSSMKKDSKTIDLARKVGAQAFISKPADPDRLLKILDDMLYEYNSSFTDNRRLTGNRLDLPDSELLLNPLDKKSAGTQYNQLNIELMSKLPCIVWTIDSRGKILFINKTVEKITGFPVRNIIKMGKRGCLNRVHESDADRVRTAYKNLFRHNTPLEIEYRFQCQNGNVIWLYEESGLPYKKDGLLHVDSISMDISKRKYMEADLLQSRQNEAVKSFAKGVDHDLNNLFKGISGYLELSTMDSVSASDKEHYLANALEISCNALKMTEIFSILSSEREPGEKSVLFSHLVSKITRSVLNNSGIRYRLEIPPDIWPCMVDSILMEQAVENLITNAAEAVEVDGFIDIILENVSFDKKMFFHGKAAGEGRYIKAAIIDNGQGIDSRNLHKIFYPYYSEKASGIKNGVGLSLALSEVVIKQHGGFIKVRSRKEEGSAMDIYLPVIKTESDLEQG